MKRGIWILLWGWGFESLGLVLLKKNQKKRKEKRKNFVKSLMLIFAHKKKINKKIKNKNKDVHLIVHSQVLAPLFSFFWGGFVFLPLA